MDAAIIKQQTVLEKLYLYLGLEGGSVKATYTDIASKIEKSVRQTTRIIKELAAEGRISVESKRGRSGGVIISFAGDYHKFDNTPKEKSPKRVPKKVKVSKFSLPEELKSRSSKSRADQYLQENHYQLSAFQKVRKDNRAGLQDFYVKLLADVYNRYSKLYNNSQRALDSFYLESSRITFSELFTFCYDNKINPVYYMSSVFGYYQHVSNGNSIPYPNAVFGEKAVQAYNNQIEYDRKAFDENKYYATEGHQSIKFGRDTNISALNYMLTKICVEHQDWGTIVDSASEIDSKEVAFLTNPDNEYLYKFLLQFKDDKKLYTSLIKYLSVVFNGRGSRISAVFNPSLTDMVSSSNIDEVIAGWVGQKDADTLSDSDKSEAFTKMNTRITGDFISLSKQVQDNRYYSFSDIISNMPDIIPLRYNSILPDLNKMKEGLM